MQRLNQAKSGLLLAGLLSGPASAAPAQPEGPFKPRINAWSMGLQARQLQYGQQEDSRLHVANAALDISRVWINEGWWASVDVSLVLGPYSSRLPTSPPLDFNGTGFSARWAYPLLAKDLRQPGGDWGLSIGVESYELIGRSFRKQTLPSGSISDSWTVRSRWIAVVPGLFYSRLQPARPKGNRPEWLMTRIEGYTFQLNLSVPVQGTIRVSSTLDNFPSSRRSELKGFAAIFSAAAWLGI